MLVTHATAAAADGLALLQTATPAVTVNLPVRVAMVILFWWFGVRKRALT
jgi:hypothetical protein